MYHINGKKQKKIYETESESNSDEDKCNFVSKTFCDDDCKRYVDRVANRLYSEVMCEILNNSCNCRNSNNKREKGESGDRGTNGKDGKDGERGATILTGFGVISEHTGIIGDFYIDLSVGDLYKKFDTWVLQANIFGSKGERGSKGECGRNGEKGEIGETGKIGEKGESGAKGESGRIPENPQNEQNIWKLVINEKGNSLINFIPISGPWSTDGNQIHAKIEYYTVLIHKKPLPISIAYVFEIEVKFDKIYPNGLVGLVSNWNGQDILPPLTNISTTYYLNGNKQFDVRSPVYCNNFPVKAIITGIYNKIKIVKYGNKNTIIINDNIVGSVTFSENYVGDLIGIWASNAEVNFQNLKVWMLSMP